MIGCQEALAQTWPYFPCHTSPEMKFITVLHQIGPGGYPGRHLEKRRHLLVLPYIPVVLL
jgi:hypothetical protein